MHKLHVSNTTTSMISTINIGNGRVVGELSDAEPQEILGLAEHNLANNIHLRANIYLMTGTPKNMIS